MAALHPLNLTHTRDGRPILWQADLDHWDPSPKRSGGRLRYRCPLHDSDHQESFSLDPGSGRYKCHACGEAGTLRDFWPDNGGTAGRRMEPPSFEEKGKREAARATRAEQERAERLAAELPAHASTFFARLDAMNEALRDPACPGAIYLRGRGLDPLRAAALGAGYAEPNVWPGDRYENDGRGLKSGRVVYPLADPATGRLVSAVGRLCVDPTPEWSEGAYAIFKAAKQRKLGGCPAGVWPYAGIDEARRLQSPLILAEGPADALALTQHEALAQPVLALVGTGNVLTQASVRGLDGVVLALDDDDAGRKGTHKARVDLAVAGVRAEIPPRGWLQGAKDPGELARDAAGDAGGDVVAQRSYLEMIAALTQVCASFYTRDGIPSAGEGDVMPLTVADEEDVEWF